MRASSPSREHVRVGVVPRNPESVTSSTVSPIERTSVALVKDTTMKASYSSDREGKSHSITTSRNTHDAIITMVLLKRGIYNTVKV